MSTFTNRELAVCQGIGAGGFALGLIMLMAGLIARSRGIGVPEYVTALRGSGALIVLVGGIFAGLATLRRIVGNQ